MSTPVDSPFMLSDCPLNKKLLGELQSIAAFMKLDATLKKDALLRAIQRHMKDHPELADDPRLVALFAHRSSPKNGPKNSAVKAAEEEVEMTKPQPAATGQAKICGLSSEADFILGPTDPPPSFAKLSSGGHKDATESEYEDGSDSSEEGDPAPRDVVATPEPEIKDETVDNNQRMKGIVHVNFYDELDHKKTLRQVMSTTSPFNYRPPYRVVGRSDQQGLYSTLIPAAIQNDSPMKERSGRLYRPNIRDDPQHHHLGKINALLDGSASALKVNAMNEYTLRTSDEATFECDIFWDQLTGGAIASQTEGHEGHTENPKEHERAGAAGLKDEKMDGPKVFTGAGSDIPLDIANDRAAHDPMHKNTSAAQRERFAQFVHGKIQEAVPGIPDFQEEWARCNYAWQMLDRHLLQEAAMKFMDDQKWSLTHGGFRVPRRLHLLEEALTIKTSSTADIDRYFIPEMLQNAPDALAWVGSGGKTNDSTFRKMRSARFKEYLKEDHRDHRKSDKESSRGKVRRRRSSSGSRGEGPSRKYRRSSRSPSIDEHRDRSGRRKVGRKERVTSEELD
ncbi:hypothetical protein DFH09DRAFT_1413021 [Mycena vulgaris]|nr:hypothetical protein DFH09DRAFT_1413021 [Mycena vulgaris]